MGDKSDRPEPPCGPCDRGRRTLPRISPATDILEREDGFYIYMDMPGVGADGLSLDLKGNELSVRGRTGRSPETCEKFVEVEFCHGEYRRSFTLSKGVDTDRIRARLKDGVLEIFLPKTLPTADPSRPRRIEIETE